MNPLEQYNSRNASAFTIPIGGKHPLTVNGDYFNIETLTNAAVTVSLNDGPFTPCPVGLIHSGPVGENHVGKLVFRNDSGVDVQVVVIYGKGKMEITGQTSLVNPTFALSPGDLLAITPAPVARVPDFDVLTGSVTYSNLQSLTINNIGGTNVVVNGKNLPPGAEVSFGLSGHDYFIPVTVNATGGTALVTTVT